MKILLALLVLQNVITLVAGKETPRIPSAEEIYGLFPNNLNTTRYEEVGNITVKTSLGLIHGKTVQTDIGFEMKTFIGIPYSKPPVGDLRFKPPVPVESYENFEAFTFGSSCLQIDIFQVKKKDILIKEDGAVEGNEDCLYLNVFSKENNSTDLQPVMFFIHGGGLESGSAPLYDPASLVNEDVVVVTINYRLGALGFLNFGNDVAPGNLGIRDQIQALQWVKMMIHHFGGDPNKITIFGESAGAMSCNAIAMSPKAAGLITGVIMESGSMLWNNFDAETTKTHRAAERAAAHFNCSSTNYDNEMLSCLQDLTLEQIFMITDEVVNGKPFQPIVDSFSFDPVLPIDFLTAIRNGNFARVPIITGTLKFEGALQLPPGQEKETFEAAHDVELSLKSSFDFSETTDDEKIKFSIMKKYYRGNDTLEDYSNLFTDVTFLAPDQKLAELSSQYVPVFNYHFTFPVSYSLSHNSLRPVHADDLFYIFDLIEQLGIVLQ